jgi:hypothetical protein
MIDNRFTFGVVGGLGALAGADFLQQLIRVTASDHDRYAIVLSSRAFRVTGCVPTSATTRPAANFMCSV